MRQRKPLVHIIFSTGSNDDMYGTGGWPSAQQTLFYLEPTEKAATLITFKTF